MPPSAPLSPVLAVSDEQATRPLAMSAAAPRARTRFVLCFIGQYLSCARVTCVLVGRRCSAARRSRVPGSPGARWSCRGPLLHGSRLCSEGLAEPLLGVAQVLSHRALSAARVLGGDGIEDGAVLEVRAFGLTGQSERTAHPHPQQGGDVGE